MKIFMFPVRGVKNIRAVNLEDAIKQYQACIKKGKTQVQLLYNQQDVDAFLDLYKEKHD